MLRTQRNFSIYSSFQKQIQSASLQCVLMEALYSRNLDNPEPKLLVEFLREKEKGLQKRLSNLKSFNALAEKFGNEKRPKHVEQEMNSLHAHCSTIGTELESGFWLMKLKGQPIGTKWKMKHLFKIFPSDGSLLIHPLFRLITSHDLIQKTPKQLLKYLSGNTLSALFKDGDTHIPDSFLAFPVCIKQSYSQQRERLAQILTLDSLTALIIIALFQQHFLKKPRPTNAEIMAYSLFKKLFCVKYPIKYPAHLAVRICQLLNHYSHGKKDLLTHEDEEFALQYFEEIFNQYQEAIFKSKKQLLLSDQSLNSRLKKYELLTQIQPRQTSFFITSTMH